MSFLSEAENRASFFGRIERYYPSLDYRYRLIEEAYNDAKKAFKDQKRDNGVRYFEHLRIVALILIEWLHITDHVAVIAAILHDLVEDCPEWTIERVRLKYGDDVALILQYMTKPPVSDFGGDKEKRNDFYYGRFYNAPRIVIIIKLADRLHNMITLWDCTPDKQQRIIESTKKYLMHYAYEQIILIHELEEAIEALESS